jgi:hypothetical protein
MRSPDVFCAGTAKGSIKTRSGDAVNYISFQSPAGSMALYRPGSSFTAKLPGNTAITMKVYTDARYVFTKTFQSGAVRTEMNLGEIDLTNPPVTVHGIVSCGNTPLSGATAKFDWAGGSLTVTSNASGDITAKIPTGQQVTVTVSHAKGSRTVTFRTEAAAGGEQSVGDVINVCAATGVVGENSFVISGDGYNKTPKTLVYDKKSSFATYDVNLLSPNSTVVDVRDVSDSLRVVLRFTGKATGAAPQDGTLHALIQRKLSNGKYINYFVDEYHPGSTVSITVTRYDEVNGLVEGTFSGTFRETANRGKTWP